MACQAIYAIPIWVISRTPELPLEFLVCRSVCISFKKRWHGGESNCGNMAGTLKGLRPLPQTFLHRIYTRSRGRICTIDRGSDLDLGRGFP